MRENMRVAMYDQYGAPEVLYVGEARLPEVATDRVLIRVHASTVNGGEVSARAGKLRLLLGSRFPKKIGLDFVGEVVSVGSSVTRVTPGDRVWGIADGLAFGAMADYVAVRPDRIAAAPTSLSAPDAASLVAGGTTAITGLRDKGRLQPGERLLVRGASGGAGSLAVQIGKLFGAHVTGLASAASADFVRSLGADEVLDYRETPLEHAGAFDVVYNAVGTEHRALRRLLRPGGRLVAISFDLDRLAPSLGYILGSTVFGPRRVRFFSGQPRSSLLAELARLADDGAIQPVVDTEHPLEDIAAAHRALESGGVRGKHVISLT
ncbi:NAD(P)-dependent alcohol dehydrogenase [Brachybacterium alimentarium]|uniref:NAD(P)-dependent alcohol dehydrogenase n=1 Tax=Brachybacterium alimentarium TaxID=47845 RepID=UPI003FD2CECE